MASLTTTEGSSGYLVFWDVSKEEAKESKVTPYSSTEIGNWAKVWVSMLVM